MCVYVYRHFLLPCVFTLVSKMQTLIGFIFILWFRVTLWFLLYGMGGPAVRRTLQTTPPGIGTAFSCENSGTCKLCIIILKGLLQPLG